MRPTKAVIDLSAFKHNLAIANARAEDAEVVPVIKADAYGHGIECIATAVSGSKAVAVACVDEAQTLRLHGFSAPILILEGPLSEGEVLLAIRQNFILVIHSGYQLDWLLSALSQADIRHGERVSIWLKVNSGMNRLGFPCAQLSALVKRLQAKACLRVLGVMSHYACADDNEVVTAQQYQSIMAALGLLSEKDRFSLSSGRLSLANSAALLQFPAYKGDMVRPGIMLYGASPIIGKTANELDLRPVMTLTSAVIAKQKVKAGEGVGYGYDWLADSDSEIAIVAIGYGDGYPRHAPSGTPVAINGKRAPIAGRVSMDMLAVDVTGLNVEIGDSVELWGKYLPVDEIAACCGTIAYELLTGVTKRVPRVVKSEAVVNESL